MLKIGDGMINCEAVAAASAEGRPSFSQFFLHPSATFDEFTVSCYLYPGNPSQREILVLYKISRQFRKGGKLGNVELSFFFFNFFFRSMDESRNAYFSFHGKFKVIEIASHPEASTSLDNTYPLCSLRVNFNGANEPA